MLMVGDHTIPQSIYMKDTIIYNLSSMLEGFPRLRLMPSWQMDVFDELSFDIAYAQFILQNDFAFFDMMQIAANIANGYHVYLMISKEYETYLNYAASLLKFIQQRYGYNSIEINSIEDYMYARDDSTFSVPGVLTFDDDMKRFTEMMVRNYGLSETESLPEGQFFITR